MRLTKIYEAPKLEVVQLSTEGMIADSPPGLQLNSLPSQLSRQNDPFSGDSFWDEF